MKILPSAITRPLFRGLAAAAILSLTLNAAAEKAETIASFYQPDSTKIWQSVNDGVMGGRSKGGFERIERKTLLFTGDLSLENGGGFASIRTVPREMNLGGATGLIVKARGDGRTYRMQLRTDDRMATSYRVDFPTAKGVLSEVLLPFSDFKLQTFGTIVPKSDPVDPAEINSFGFSVADKKAGPFEFELESVKAFRGEIGAPVEDTPEKSEAPVQNASFIENSLTVLSYQRPLPAKMAMMAEIGGPARILNARPTLPPKIHFNDLESAESMTDFMHIQRGSTITVYDREGREQRSFDIPQEVKFYLDFKVLPDGRMAFFNNEEDTIYFVSKDGKHLKTVPISNEPDRRLQGMRGVVVEDKLIVSENGYNELLSVDLETYEVSVFRSLKELKGWLGAIAYSDGVFYLCQSKDIYSFTSDSDELTKLGTTQKGNIRSAAVVDGRLSFLLKEPGGLDKGSLYEIDLESGKMLEVQSALKSPQGMMLLKPKNL